LTWVDGADRSGVLVSRFQVPWYNDTLASWLSTHCAGAAPFGITGIAGRLVMALPDMLIWPCMVPPEIGRNTPVCSLIGTHCPTCRAQVCPFGTVGTSGTPAVATIVST
jgi:hypothetical protein